VHDGEAEPLRRPWAADVLAHLQARLSIADLRRMGRQHLVPKTTAGSDDRREERRTPGRRAACDAVPGA